MSFNASSSCERGSPPKLCSPVPPRLSPVSYAARQQRAQRLLPWLASRRGVSSSCSSGLSRGQQKTCVPTHRTVPLASLQPHGFTGSPPKLGLILKPELGAAPKPKVLFRSDPRLPPAVSPAASRLPPRLANAQRDGCEDTRVLPGYPSTRSLSRGLFWVLDTSAQHTVEHFKGKICRSGLAILPRCFVVLGRGDNQRVVLANISHHAAAPGELPTPKSRCLFPATTPA